MSAAFSTAHVAVRVPAGARPPAVAELVSRSRGDAELVDALRAGGFQGPGWRLFEHELRLYGLARVQALVAVGALLTGLGEPPWRPAGGPGGRVSTPELTDLLHGSVHLAVDKFVTYDLRGGGWNPTDGTSLTGCFTNACVLGFLGRYKTWRTPRPHRIAVATLDAIAARVTTAAGSADDAEVIRLTRALDALTKTEVSIFCLLAQGFTHQDIAGQLHLTTQAVGRRIDNARARTGSARHHAGRE
jgi:DNA-binding CsgD family transcriptional regulator